MMRYYLRCVLAVLGKDITCELRARHALGAILLFAVTSTIAVSFTLSGWGSKSEVASALLWIVLYFSAMSGLGRSFVHEEEMRTAALLKFSTRPNSVYLGKLAFNWMLLLCVQIVTVPLFVMLMGCRVDHWGAFIALLLVGSFALSAGATMAAAMVARASVKGALFAVISFPLLVPVLASAIHGTGLAMSGHSAASDIRLLTYYSGTVITASLMLFKFIWED
ncbi:MAG: heme exporter protein CcmB [Armatimonadota bacterium]|nr:heme exporter protein CcmB [bacterium]